MKITCLLGSPRTNGNCSVLLKKFQDSARVFGAETQYYALRDLNYRGCLGCLACKTRSEGCIIQDDLTPVLESVRAADVLAMATPVYFREMTALLRAFIERTYSFFLPDFHTNPNPSRLKPGKKMVFVQIQGQADDKLFGDIFPRIEPLFQRYGYGEMHVARICGVRKIGDVEGVNGTLALMEDIAERLINGKPVRARRELLSPLVSYKITIQNW